MKQKVFLSIATLALGLGACTSDLDDVFSVNSGKDVVSVTIAPETRTEFSTNGKSIVWSTGDQIGIFCGEKNDNIPYTLSGTPSGNSATFTGISSGTKKAAVYPYNSGATFDGTSTIATTLASEIAYSTSTINGAPMAALISEDAQDAISFKNPGAIMEIKVTNIPDGYNAAKLSAGEQNIAGNAQIAFADGIPTLTIVEDAANSSPDITIKFSSTKKEMVFYFPLPVADYTKLTFSLIKDDSELNVFSKALNAVRNTKYFKYFTFDAVDAEIPSEAVSGTAAATETLKELSAVVVTVGEEETPEISLPTAIGAGPVSITFSAISTTKPITIKETDEEATAATEVNIASEEKTAANNNLVIELPNSTVNINKGEYTSIEASTAENTLILANGVKVETLTVKKGNVRIKEGATITTLVKSASFQGESNPLVIKENGATLPSDISESDFEIVDAALYDLQKVCEDGGECVLADDIDIQGKSIEIASGKEVILDLNGKTITADNSATGRIMVKGKLTLKNSGSEGKIVATKDYASGVSGGIIQVDGTSAQMTMESGSINTVRNNATDKGQFGVVVKDGATFNMTGGEIKAGWYAVSGNGTDVTNKSTVNISGGSLISTADYALYLPHNGETTISGGTVNGAAGGICINRGTLNVSGTAKILSTDTGNTGSWGDGTGGLGNASLNANAKYGDVTVNVTGGTFTADQAALNVATGSTNTVTMNITGGTFSDLSVFKYIKENANVNVTLNKDVEIKNTALLNAANSKVTLDLNGKTIKNGHVGTEEWTSDCDAITVKNGTLTISGDGTIQTLSKTGSPIYASGTNATINIQNGFYLSDGLNPSNGWSLIYADGGAKINISGGYYAVNGKADEKLYEYVLNCKDNSTSVITLTGGYFYEANPSQHDHVEEVVIESGYSVTQEDDVTYKEITGTWYKVSKTTTE